MPHNAGEIIDTDNATAIAIDLMAMIAPVQIYYDYAVKLSRESSASIKKLNDRHWYFVLRAPG